MKIGFEQFSVLFSILEIHQFVSLSLLPHVMWGSFDIHYMSEAVVVGSVTFGRDTLERDPSRWQPGGDGNIETGPLFHRVNCWEINQKHRDRVE